MLQRIRRPGACVLSLIWCAALAPAAQTPGGLYAERFASHQEKSSEAADVEPAPGALHAERFVGAAHAAPEPDRQEVRASVTRALLHLAAAQRPDGSWDPGGEPAAAGGHVAIRRVGVSALCLLAFLEAGHTPEQGPFKLVVERGLEWLLSRQDAELGLVGERLGHAYLYDHGIATFALCEALRRAPETPGLAQAARRAVDCVLRARNPYGAWRYDLPPAGDNDTSVTGWMVHALKAAEGAGLRVDSEAFVGALAWLDQATDPETGRTGYDTRGGPSSRMPGVNDAYPTERGEGMTAVALACRLLVGQREETTPVLARHAALLLRQLPEWDPEGLGTDMYFWFFGTRALRGLGGDRWLAWRASLVPALLAGQEDDGSWPPVGPWGRVGGRSYATALMALCLEAAAGTDGGPAVAGEVREGPLLAEEQLEDEPVLQDHVPPPEALEPRVALAARQSVELGLRWLERHQSEDGRWDADGFMQGDPLDDRCTGAGSPVHDVGVTALVLLAFLEGGDGELPPEHRLVVTRGLQWLREQQDPVTGQIGASIGHAYQYDHAIATQALCKGYAAAPSPQLERSCREAALYALRSRNPYGAWRYDMPPVGDNDTSVTGWMVAALVAAEEAGLPVDRAAYTGALNWIDEVTDPVTGRVGYDTRGSLSSRITSINDDFPPEMGEAMTAVGLHTRLLLGQRVESDPILARHAELCLATPPRWQSEPAGGDMYYWVHGTLAMRRLGGAAWPIWRAALLEASLGSQRADGAHEGSWDPVGPWGMIGGRVYSTALMVLALEAALS